MLLGGDEIGRTQRGNNNAYCQDNEISWYDWGSADTTLLEFVRRLIQLRKEHPVFAQVVSRPPHSRRKRHEHRLVHPCGSQRCVRLEELRMLPEIAAGSSDGLPRERSGRDFPASVPEQLSVGLGAFRRRNPKHRVSAISRDRIANARDGALWIFSSLQRANSLAQQLPNQGHTAIRGSQVFQRVDGDGPLALLRLVVARLALTIFIGAIDRLRASQRAGDRALLAVLRRIAELERDRVGVINWNRPGGHVQWPEIQLSRRSKAARRKLIDVGHDIVT